MERQTRNREILTIPSNPRQLRLVREFVSRMVRESPLSASAENKVVLAVDEAVTNIMEHGYAKQSSGEIEIEIDYTETAFQVRIRDHAPSFNPQTVPDADVLNNVKSGQKRGLGIFLMRQIMDEIAYRLLDGGRNELTLIKRISSEPS